MSDCLVVGGGIIGLFTAYFLSETGTKVTVVDKGPMGREASWAGGGVLSPLYPWRTPLSVWALAQQGQRAYPQLAQNLLHATGIDPEWTRSGLLILDANERSDAQRWCQATATEFEILNAKLLSELQPGLDPALESGLLLPDVAQIRTPRLIKALTHYLAAKGVSLLECVAVQALSVTSGRITGVTTESEQLVADCVVVAGGAWSQQLVPESDADFEVRPIRGQMIAFNIRPDELHYITLRDDQYLIPRRDGTVLAGSTLEDVGFDKSLTEEDAKVLSAAAISMFPKLSQVPIAHHWCGLRPASASGTPYICAYPGVEGLYINTGHHRNGIVTAPASAKLLVDLMLGRQQDPEGFTFDFDI